MMNDIPARILRELVKEHGDSFLTDPRRCRALLMDSCGEYKKEIHVLIGALLTNVPTDLLASEKVPHDILKERLASKLCAEFAITQQAANWSIEAWSAALTNSHNLSSSGDEPDHSVQQGQSFSGPRTIKVSPDNEELLRAVGSAQPKDIISLSQGTYRLDSALKIDKSIKIKGQGAESTVISFQSADGQLLLNGGAWQLEGIKLLTASQYGVAVNEGELLVAGCQFTSTHASGTGLLLNNCSGQVLESIFSDNHHAGIVMSGNSKVDLLDNKFVKNTCGLIYTGHSAGTAKKNDFQANEMGIYLSDNASPNIEDNYCSDNECGIKYMDNSAGRAYKNKCSANTIGMRIAGHAQPNLFNNLCTGNKDAGIVYSESAGGFAKENESKDNQYGIRVGGDASPRLEHNLCIKNSDTGIAYWGNAAGSSRENTCAENKLNGISVSDNATPELEGNTCTKNTQSGIIYWGNSSGLAAGNHCQENLYGIAINNQSKPQLLNNKCLSNKSGIAYFDNATGTASENECCNNQLHGISVNGKASPELERNICSTNTQSGITYWGSATGSARENKCLKNKLNGICVSESAAPELEQNICSDNSQSGIIYWGTSSGYALENKCQTNEYNGISVREEASPAIRSNLCANNQENGISYHAKATGSCNHNTCSSNSNYGIYIGEDASPKLKDNRVSNNLKGQIFPDPRGDEIEPEPAPPPAIQGPTTRFWLFSLLVVVCLSWLVFNYLCPSIFILREITGFWSRIAYSVRLTGPYVVFAGGLAGTCLYNYRRSYPQILYSVFAWGGGTIIAGLLMYTYILPALIVALLIFVLVVWVGGIAADDPQYFIITLLAASALSAIVFFFIYPHDSLLSRSVIASSGIVASLIYNVYSILELEESYFLSITASALTMLVVGVLIYLLPFVTWLIIGLYGLLLIALTAFSIYIAVE